VVTEAFAGQQGGEFHEAGALAWAAVLAAREHREQRWWLMVVAQHEAPKKTRA
jgi:hypothetical protein